MASEHLLVQRGQLRQLGRGDQAGRHGLQVRVAAVGAAVRGLHGVGRAPDALVRRAVPLPGRQEVNQG